MATTDVVVNRQVAARVLDAVDAGLCKGVGRPVPGQMCVEAAVCFAMGLPHGDEPACVGRGVRDFKIRLNDCYWSSDLARARGLRKLAIAQLGSDGLDQESFQERLAFLGLKKVLPAYMRKYEAKYRAEIPAADGTKWLGLASSLEAAADFESAKKIVIDNRGFGFGFGFGFGVGVGVGFGVGFGFGFGFGFGVGVGFGETEFREFFGDDFLMHVADVGLEVLVEMKSPGCEWLDLCGSPAPVVG